MSTTTTETWGHHAIITNGIRMHYVTQGEGPLIVLLHGFPAFWYSFVFQIPWLPETLLRRNHANAIGRMLNAAAVQKAAFPREITAKYQEAMSKPGAMTAALNYYRQLFRRLPGTAREKMHISTPTLLIWGEQDIALGIKLTTGLEQWVDNIQVKRLPDS